MMYTDSSNAIVQCHMDTARNYLKLQTFKINKVDSVGL